MRPDLQEAEEECTGLGIWVGREPKLVQTIEVKHYCENCDEVMMRAWGDECPICHGPIKRVLPSSFIS